jgi:ArsR family transcriptional regulator, arsenate/arsenite/antimonite-responsive transcriptional repressor
MRASYAKALPRNWQRIALVFTALGEEHRQRILLMFAPGEKLSVAAIVTASALSRSAVAHHLAVMRAAGVLHAQRAGREVFYTPDPQAVRAALDAVRDYLDAHFPPSA